MKRFLYLIVIFLFPLMAKSQGMFDPTKWTISYSKNELKVNETVDIIFNVSIEDNWHLYSLGEEPPQLLFTFEGDGFKLVGKAKEKGSIHTEEATGNNYFEGKVEFRQTVKIVSSKPNILIDIEGQACPTKIGDGKGPSQCIRVIKSFKVTSDELKILSAANPPKTNSSDQGKIKTGDTTTATSVTPAKKDTSTKDSLIVPKPGTTSGNNKPLGKIEGEIEKNESSLLALLLLSFGAGLLSLLTPCVFPMIPLTVTFFSTSSESRKQAIRKALFYGFSIIIIFTLIGIFAGPFLANIVSTHWIPNLIFFLIFMIFGLSFLGLFEITLPSSFVNKVDQQSEKGGYYGVFFMAFTLVLVSFSCTAPIVGFVLVQLHGGITLRPILTMIAFSSAFAIPFTLFALFPQWLQKLPRSGGWLNVIKVVLGFVEIGLAFKFLSMIDMVYHLHLLDREIYISIWIVLSTLTGLYLLGNFKLPHDSDIAFLSVPRLMLSIVPFVFTLYLFPGLFGAPLKMLSGYLPPMNTHDFDLPGIIRENVSAINDKSILCTEPKYNNKLSLPHGLKGYFTYEEAIKCAKEKNMPIFLDFTGHACVTCREMEANVWSDPQVLKKLRSDFVLTALYVDDRTLLEKQDQYKSPFSNRTIKTLGAKNTELTINKFKTNSQPYYILLDPFDETILVKPIGYEPSTTEYLNFLNEGIQNFKNKHRK